MARTVTPVRPFQIVFRPDRLQPQTITWTRFYPTLAAATADAYTRVPTEYPQGRLILVTQAPDPRRRRPPRP